MMLMIGRGSRALLGLALASAALVLAGCATPKPYVPASTAELPFEQAVAQAANGVIDQARALIAFRFGLGRHGVVVDPMLDASTGQQTAATQALEQRVTQRLAAGLAGAEFLPFQSASLAKADYLLTGTFARTLDGRSRGSLRLNLALTDLKSGLVVAQAWAMTRDEGLDGTPLRYYGDSPVLVRDRVVDGYIATTATAAGQPADPYYLKRIAVASVINDATGLYNAERYPESLERYGAARAADGGEQLRVLTGLYLNLAKLGKTAEADEAFGTLAAYGIANDQLRVKFLFNPGSTVFWSDPKVSGPYAMWLRQIAKEGTTAKTCMSVVGHTSRTGSEALNDALSLERAGFIRQRLIVESGAIADRSQAQGRGYRENIIGSGTDDAVDALDRRVEFKVTPCT